MSGNYTLQSYQCPKCGATLPVIPDQDTIHCEYCNNTFSLREKSAPTPETAPTPQPATPNPNYDYTNAYVATQKRMIQSGKKTAKFGALFAVIVTLGMVGFGVFMSTRAQKEVKERQREALLRAKNQREAFKQRERDRVQKQWLDFKASNSEKIDAKKIVKFEKLIKALNIPSKGASGSRIAIYCISRFGVRQMSRLNTFRKKMRAFQARWPGKFKWYFVPVPRDKRDRFKGVDALFEALHQQGAKIWWKLWRKQLRHSYYHFGTKDMTKLARKVKLNVKDFRKALKHKVHKEKLDKLESIAEEFDIPDSDITFLIKTSLYNSYSALSRIDYVFEHELGLKK